MTQNSPAWQTDCFVFCDRLFRKRNGWWVCGTEDLDRWIKNRDQRLSLAVKYVRDFSLALDIGAHIGLYARWLGERFDRVVALEPSIFNRMCLEQNVQNIEILPYAADEIGGMWDTLENNGIDCHLISGGLVEAVTIDSLCLNPGFIKIDAEGFDLRVLRGAVKTLARTHPVVFVENKVMRKKRHSWWYSAGQIETFMYERGFRLVEKFAPDQVFQWQG